MHLIRLLILVVLYLICVPAAAQPNVLGMVSTLENDSLLFSAGFRIIGTTVENTFAPALSEQEFLKSADKVRNSKCKVFMCNVLFPGSLKIAGPDVNEKEVLRYLEKILKRAQQLDIKHLVLGSAGARRLPEGANVDLATRNFIRLSRKMAALAQTYNVTIILENLNRKETNFLNSLSAAAEVVRKVNHPNFRLNADIYHMMMEDESPQEIVKAGSLIVYCEIAEKEKRTLPGIAKDDFKPYLRALRKINYDGPLMIEGNSANLKQDAPAAFQYLKTQIAEVYSEP
jgi:sugar phosphate isomerase/epimerase